jgi:hypothetical protein
MKPGEKESAMQDTMESAISSLEAAIRRFRLDAILLEHVLPDELGSPRSRELTAKALGALAFATEDMNEIGRRYESIIARCQGREPSEIFVHDTGAVIDEDVRAEFDKIARETSKDQPESTDETE